MGYAKNNTINSNTSKKFKWNIKAPKEMKLNKKSEHFWWFSQLEMKRGQNGTHEIQKGIVIYNSPILSFTIFQAPVVLNTYLLLMYMASLCIGARSSFLEII